MYTAVHVHVFCDAHAVRKTKTKQQNRTVAIQYKYLNCHSSCNCTYDMVHGTVMKRYMLQLQTSKSDEVPYTVFLQDHER